MRSMSVKLFGGNSEKLLIAGAGGHGIVIEDLARKTGCYTCIRFLDDDEAIVLKNRKVIGCIDYAVEHRDEFDVIIAVGDPAVHEKIQNYYEAAGVNLVTLIHPSAVLPESGLAIGKGTVVMAGAIIQPETTIGNGVIINTASSVDHGCRIGDYTHIAVGSHLAGNVRIGKKVWIGAGAVVSNNVSICEETVVGAGAVVVNNIVECGTYVGVPARRRS